jgi:Protein of unknown function (DUF3489)
LVSLRPASRARPGSGGHIGAARKPETNMTEETIKTTAAITAPKATSKLDCLEKLLKRKNGASIVDMTKATGWQQHSVRGALAGAVKKRGHNITSDKIDGTRRYRIETGE